MKFKDLAEYLLTCAVLGFVGARLLFVISMLPSMKQITINEIFYYLQNGGLVFYGGLMGVLCGIVVIAKYKKENVKEKLNLLTPVFPLFHAFARFGCLLAGCCYGRQWSWGVIMASEPGVIRFPVQLIESLCDIIIFIGLMVWEKKRKTNQHNLEIYLCSYAACRFVLEFYRGDEIRGIWFGGLSTAQYVSLGIWIGYIIQLIKNIKIRNV